ncbi:hypothetical protein B0H21DRAFT_823407 [Amylocystis lapponica]|nr:hypothetical protein B0H21DRAFT_823407 [Amylocystis lapponica]
MAPPNITVRYVEKPTEALVEEAIQIFTKLMPDDLGMLAFSGGNPSLLPDVGVPYHAHRLISGEMYTATDENGVLVGFTLEKNARWLLHVAEPPADEDKAYFPSVSFCGFARPGLRINQPFSDSKELSAFIDESTESRRRPEYWWCSAAMVSVDYQGKGWSRPCSSWSLRRQGNRALMALSNTNIHNVEIFERLGFELKGHRVMKSPWTDWPLWVFLKNTTA